jgi:hypothetical protein
VSGILTGAEAAAVLDRRAERPARWFVRQCDTADLVQMERLGADWEPFAVTRGPDDIQRIWWRKRGAAP